MIRQRQRIRNIIEKWFLLEPLLFATWTTHALIIQPLIKTIRVRQGQIEYNPDFLQTLSNTQLEQVLYFETVRILLKHPYSRQQDNAELSYLASNLAIQENLQSSLPFPYAETIFATDEFNNQYLEFYYYKLQELMPKMSTEHQQGNETSMIKNEASMVGKTEADQLTATDDSTAEEKVANGHLTTYTNAKQCGQENAVDWEEDELFVERLDQIIERAEANHSWGSIAGQLRERILATLKPKLDYRKVLRHFRASILGTRRILTRMKPSRRYGFDYLGSRREFNTYLLFAVDVSGSMSSHDIRQGFSIINRFFKYGITVIDVLYFDTEIRSERMQLNQARRELTVEGRGGTSFEPLMVYLDQHRQYDGLIIFTDGYCFTPTPPRNRRTRILWLFNHESSYQQNYPQLRHLGYGAFIKADKRV